MNTFKEIMNGLWFLVLTVVCCGTALLLAHRAGMERGSREVNTRMSVTGVGAAAELKRKQRRVMELEGEVEWLNTRLDAVDAELRTRAIEDTKKGVREEDDKWSKENCKWGDPHRAD